MLDLVVRETRTKKRIIYVGYSLGTTTSYVYSLVRQREARQRLAALISLAPVAYMKHTHISFNFLLLFITLIYVSSSTAPSFIFTENPVLGRINIF
jgi:pimeloyl-ACP methyl ester carboxylesterase